MCSGSVTGWGGWFAGWEWSRLCRLHFASGRPSCTCSFESPACLWILGSAILARKEGGRVVLMKQCRVSLFRSLHHFMPRKLNTPQLLFLDLGSWFLYKIFRFLYCGPRKSFSGHCGPYQRQAHVGLFQLYPTYLSCHSSRHVENLQDISSCF